MGAKAEDFAVGPNALQQQAAQGIGAMGSPAGFGQSNAIAQGVAGAGANTGTLSTVNPVMGTAVSAGPAQTAQATTGSAERTKAESLLSNFRSYMNPATQALVDTTLQGMDSNAGRVRAQQAADAARNGAFGGSRYAIQEARTEGDLATARAASEAQLRNQAFNNAAQLSMFDTTNRQNANNLNAQLGTQANLTNAQLGTGVSQFNAGQANNQGQFNAGLSQQAMLANQGAANQAASQNAGAANNMSQFNASQQDGALQRQLQAAGLLSSNAANMSQTDIARAMAQMQIGNQLYGIEQNNAMLPFQIAQMQGSLLNPGGTLNTVTGQTINANGKSHTVESKGLLGSLLEASAQAAAAYASSGCDERIKKDIQRIGETDGGLPLYRFRYIDGDGSWVIGPMAQEVEIMQPEALGPLRADGAMTVYFGEIV